MILEQQATELLAQARSQRSGRASHLVVGGPESTMTQTLIALRDGTVLGEHQNPGEATVLVLSGQVRLISGESRADGGRGELLEVPPEPHSVEALADSVFLLTAVKRSHTK